VYRNLEKVSGGKRVSVLLALLLNGEDSRPLVIDQPEDELDAAFLANDLLGILRRLKGRRQIIFATHNANIVVNGDADCVICLDANHEEGRVLAWGAIEDPQVKQTILETVDGGKSAFELRAAKYGY
jgi:ABC-type Mn2+/Zn2+ transport system ATPase subunit